MATPSKKPRDIKNLKARLGRTITPGQAGAPGAGPGMPPGGSVPPPAVGGGLPAPVVGGAPQPGRPSRPPNPFGAPVPAPTPSGRPPAAGIPGAAPGGAPPGAAPRTPSGRPAAPGAGSPFAPAAAPPVGERKVTLVIDDSAVKEDEIGRKSRGRAIMMIVLGLVLGLAVGLGIGSTGASRNQYNMAVRDGKDIYNKINEVSSVLEEAKGHLKKAVDSTQGGGAGGAADYKEIEALVAMERPFGANEFSRRRYLAFPTNVVDDLFEYYNGINKLWDKFTVLNAKTAGKNKREALDKSAKAAGELVEHEFGVVLTKAGDAFGAGIVYVRRPQAGSEEAGEQEEGAAPTLMVASREGGREVTRTLFMGQDDFVEKYGDYVMLVDKGRSMPSLGGGAELFGDLRGELTATQNLLSHTLEVQGRLIQELGKVAALKETAF